MGFFGTSAKARTQKASATAASSALEDLKKALAAGETENAGSSSGDDHLATITTALAVAREACAEAGMEDEPLLKSGSIRAQHILDARLAASQKASVDEAIGWLCKLMAEAEAETAGQRELDALEAALPDAEEAGVPPSLLQTASAALKLARAQHSEKALRAAMASKSQRALHRELTSLRKAAPKGRKSSTSSKDGGRGSTARDRDSSAGIARVDPALLDEAEELLQTLRRQEAAAARLRRSVEMSGPAALAKAVEAARADPHMPAGELKKAEAALARRQKEQKLQKWLRVLQEARASLAEEALRARQAAQVEGWQLELRDGNELSAESEAGLRRELAALTDELRKRLASADRAAALSGRPRGDSAWVYLVTQAYERFPSPALSAAQLSRAKASSKQAASSQLSRTVLRALMELIRVYHPDKNGQFGRAWGAIAEELTKLAVSLYQEYQTRLELRA